MLDEVAMKELEELKMKRMKESLHGIGQEVNDLFQSNILEEDPMSISKINRDFANIIN